MKKIFIDISPGFYKTKLLTEINKKIDIFVIYTTDYDTTSRNKDFLGGDKCFPHICLKGSRMKQIMSIIRILRSTKYDECIVGGYNALSDWIPVLFSSKKNNSLILESTYRETSDSTIKVLLKKIFFERISRIYACGSPHEKLARMFGFTGEVVKWYSVGLINVIEQPAFQYREEVKNFLFVGRLIWQKNLVWLIERFISHPELNLIIVGFGEDEDMLKEKGNVPNIHFTGAIDNKLLPRYYQDADVFILPSVSETWGLVVEEALNNGTPVMLSDMVGSADDMALALGTGVVFKSNNIDDFEEKLLEITNLDSYNDMRKRIASINFLEREANIVHKFCI